MKKLVLKLDLDDDKAKHKALKRVSALSGIDYIGMDMKDKKLTVIGTVDPVSVVSKLRKYWHADIITVGPAKEPEKEEPKKEEPKEEEAKKEEPKKEEPKEELKEEPKEEEPKKEEPEKEEPKKEDPEKEEKKKEVGEQPDQVMELVKAYRAFNPQMTRYYYAQSIEENPNACVLS